MKKVCYFGIALAFAISAANAEELYELPDPIDVSARRQLLAEQFPKLNPDLKQLKGLTVYLQELEIYRVSKLEGLNADILKVCVGLNDLEGKVKSDLSKGRIAKNEHDRIIEQLRKERKNCIVPKDASSEYWPIYDNFLSLYKSSSSEALKDKKDCENKRDCLQGVY